MNLAERITQRLSDEQLCRDTGHSNPEWLSELPGVYHLCLECSFKHLDSGYDILVCQVHKSTKTYPARLNLDLRAIYKSMVQLAINSGDKETRFAVMQPHKPGFVAIHVYFDANPQVISYHSDELNYD